MDDVGVVAETLKLGRKTLLRVIIQFFSQCLGGYLKIVSIMLKTELKLV